MEKIKTGLLAIAVGLVTATCSSDDNHDVGVEPASVLLLGKWMFEDQLPLSGQPYEEITECDRKSTLYFNSNGNFYDTSYEDYISSIDSINNCELSKSGGTYEYNPIAHQITLQYKFPDQAKNDTVILYEVKITSHTLTFTFEENEYGVWSQIYKR